ncbi:MAG: flagellar motor protein MotB [Rhodospirillales bacterium]|nr:flagellar motor protein MotB [Rhodospirillales bacterium]
MAEESAAKNPIIIKKVNKGGHGHHGGAWKIAYADFVTAMMAFFLLLWLLNSVTQEQLEGISNYFAPVTASQSTSGSGDILGGKTITEEGAAQNTTSRDSVTVDLPPPKAGSGGDDNAETKAGSDQDAESAAEVLKQQEQQQFEEAKDQLEATINSIPQLKSMKDSLLIDNTPEGLRIQLVDKDGLSMFQSGSAELFLHTKRLLEVAAEIIKTLPQNISISGHTDSTRFGGGSDYSNWELSADRANAARRWLMQIGIAESRFDRVVGKAATEPLVPDNPAHPSNRRLSVIMLRGTGADNPVTKAGGKKAEEPEALPGLNKIRNEQAQSPGSGAPSRPAPASGAGQVPSLGLELDQNISR